MAIQAIVDPIIAFVSSAGAALGTAGTAIAGVAEGVGIPAALAAPIGSGIVDAGVGAALGAGEAAITGGDPLKGAEFGAITGGVGGAGGAALGELGVTGPLAGGLAGAAGGALGGLATGQNPATSALIGGAGGALASGITGAGGPAAGGGTGGASTSGIPGDIGASTVAPPVLSGPNLVPGSAPPTGGTGDSMGLFTSPTAPTSSFADGTAPSSAITGAPTQSALPGGVGTGAANPVISPTLGSDALNAGLVGGSPGPGVGSVTQSGATSPLGTAGVSPDTAAAAGMAPGITGAPQTTNAAAASKGGGIGSFLKSPAALAFGADLLMGNRSLPYQKQLEGSAAAQLAQGRQLEGYLQSGGLPPGLQMGLDVAADAARTSIRSMYAGRGMSGSSAENQDINAVGEREAAQGAQIAMQLFQMGLNEESQADSLYMALMGQQMQQDQNLSNAVANLSSAFAQAAQPVVPGGGAAVGAG